MLVEERLEARQLDPSRAESPNGHHVAGAKAGFVEGSFGDRDLVLGGDRRSGDLTATPSLYVSRHW
jgi:hypothetical protein